MEYNFGTNFARDWLEGREISTELNRREWRRKLKEIDFVLTVLAILVAIIANAFIFGRYIASGDSPIIDKF